MRQSLPDLALELSMDGIVLHKRTAPGQWMELGASRIDAPDLGANLRAMRDMADTARGQNFRTQIWLPDEQVSAHNLLLTGETQKEREQSARDALSAITPHRGEDFAMVLGAPTVSGYTPVAAVLLQTLKEARIFAEDNGFRPVGFSSRQSPAGFDFTPAFTEPPDFGPLKRKLSFVAGLGLALLIGGTVFRVADPYEIWLAPPQQVAELSALPDVSAENRLQGFAMVSPEVPARPAMQPDAMPAAAGTSGTAPALRSTAKQAGALVAAPAFSKLEAPRRLAVSRSETTDVRPGFASTQALSTTLIDLIPARKSPRFLQQIGNMQAPVFSSTPGIQITANTLPAPNTSAPVKFAASQTPDGRSSRNKLPNPTITRAFPLDNLETIVASARGLLQAETRRGAIASAPAPEAGLASALPRQATGTPRLQPAAAGLKQPESQPAAALPDVGQIAALRPLRKPRIRPADLKTEGEFERAIAEPVSEAPPPLALVVPGDTAAPPVADTPPSPPLTDVAWLSNQLGGAGIAAPVAPVATSQGPDLQTRAQPLVSPAPGDLIASIFDPAEPVDDGDAQTALATPAPEAESPLTDEPESPAAAQAEEQAEETDEIAAQEPDNRFAKYADRRPKPRPASIQQLAEKNDQTPTKYALLTSAPPKARPASLELKAAAARRVASAVAAPAASAPQAEVLSESPGTVIASIPSSASVQRAATIKNAFDQSKLSLIGVYGTAAKRRALIRLPSGRFVRVEAGDKFGGYQVASIGSNSVKLMRSGRAETLKMPK